MDEDEDVILEGSELHNHLVNNGYADFETKSPTTGQNETISDQIAQIDKNSSTVQQNRSSSNSGEGRRLVAATVWPDICNKFSSRVFPKNVFTRKLEVEIAQEILRSELLVSEDEDFINNFILSEDVLENYKKECEGGSSYLGDALLFSGSLAAVAGAVFFLSERTRAVAAAAAVLPSAMAAMSSIRLGSKVKSNSEAEQFKELLRHLISNMKTYKQLLRKSLNLIQGMEMMNQGYLMSMNQLAAAQPPQENQEGGTAVEESKLSQALCKRSSFIDLRRAIYSCTVQIIVVYRESIQLLMDVAPLADHIDLKDHYLAFIELEDFGLQHSVPDQRLSVRQLKDTIQLSLLQQSEYLRRFSLTFCDKVREEEELSKTGVLKHVKDIIVKIRKVTEKLAKVFEYHQALGLLPVPELEQRALTLRKQQSLDEVKKILPLKHVYTSLFSTGLHLQNSLLKVRHLEGFFDLFEKYKADHQENVSALLPDDEKLLEWLKGFKDIQVELNACLTCLDEGVEQIDDLKRPVSSRSLPSDETWSDLSSADSVAGSSNHNTQRVITESDEQSHMDEVFEAFISCDTTNLKFEDDFVQENSNAQTQEEKKQSKKVLKELKSVLKVKEKEFQVREAKAIARQARVNSVDFSVSENGGKEGNENGHKGPLHHALDKETDEDQIHKQEAEVATPLVKSNILGTSQLTDSDAESIRSGITVKSPDSDPGHHSDSVSFAASNRLQVNDSESLDTSDTEGEDNDGQVVKKPPSLKSLPSMSRSIHNPRGSAGSCSGTRSFSTPDLKRLAEGEAASPYVSLEKLLDDGEDDDVGAGVSVAEEEMCTSEYINHEMNGGSTSSTSSTESGAEDFKQKRSFRRPLRPAALRTRHSKEHHAPRRRSSTRDINGRSEHHNSAWPGVEPSNGGGGAGDLVARSESVYMQRNRDAGIQINTQPSGFNTMLAAAAVAKSRQMRFSSSTSFSATGEEYFGSSESETEDSSKS